MIDLGNRQILDDGTVLLSDDAAIEVLYRGGRLEGQLFDRSEAVDLYNQGLRTLDLALAKLSIRGSDSLSQPDWYATWLTPQNWAEADVLQYCLDLCSNDDQRIRVCEEIKLFQERDMIPVLQHLMWLVFNFRQRGIVWGVGRGSSVSSYVLFLIGINRIDPLKFDLDVGEFLK
jgi:Bacterial DNA polymerase III alpha NTPase domain